MRVAALVSGCGWHVEDLRRASARLDIEFHAVPFGSILGHVGIPGRGVEASGVRLGDFDGVLVRMMPPAGLEPVVFRMDALARLEASGVPVLNPARAVEAAVDKYLSLARLDSSGVPVPPTVVGESADDALAAFDALGGDVVVKPLFGSEGRGLVRVSDRETAWRVFHALGRIGSVLYVQKFVPNPGHDHRAFVLGGRVVAAMRRRCAAGEWRSNVAAGGRPESVRIPEALEDLALRAAAAVGADMAGVDLLDDLDRGETLVIEVNAVPGWRALAKVSGVDVASAVLERLRELRR